MSATHTALPEALQTVTEKLPVRLTAEELRTYGRDLAKALQDRDRIELEKKAANDVVKQKLEAIDENVNHLAAAVRTGVEDRPVQCDEIAYVSERLVEVIRRDTMEVVRTRRLSAEEAEEIGQGQLFALGPPSGVAPKSSPKSKP